MLYITTRNPADSFTAYRVLREIGHAERGMIIPMQTPLITSRKLLELKSKSFPDVVADILNLFFDHRINGWDIGFCVGRSPIKVIYMNHRLIVAQLWHNHGGMYDHLECNLYRKLTNDTSTVIPEWPKIAIRIAVLFGIYTELQKAGIDEFDIAVPADDFLLPAAVMYARKMGLPVAKVICGISKDNGIWDLIHRGEYNTGTDDNKNLCEIERLIFDLYGREETGRFLDVACNRGIYRLTEDKQRLLSADMFAAVTSANRIDGIIKSVNKSGYYLLDRDTASAYCALQDFRAKTGQSRHTLILADHPVNPV